MTLDQLQALYDIAKQAPLAKAAYAHQVSELFKIVEAELSAGAQRIAAKPAGPPQVLERGGPAMIDAG
jgi:hypothetical protein